MSARIIGITGGVGAGKSEILTYLKNNYPCVIYMADQVAKELQSPGHECYDKLVALLGRDVVSASGELDRSRMAELIFESPDLRDGVNAIVHPAVQDFLYQKMADAKADPRLKWFFVEAALLIETGYGEVVDEMWYIYADESSRIKRLMASRGYDEKKCRQIMASQLSEEDFRKACDFVIDNSRDLTDTYKQIDKRLKEGYKDEIV